MATNLRSSKTTTADDSSVPTTEHQPHPLPTDTPEWGVVMYELLTKLITKSQEEVTNQITDILAVSISNAEKKAQQAITQTEHNAQLIESLAAKIESLTDIVQCLKQQNQQQQSHILKNETYSRRENLLFRGYAATQEPCDVIVRRIMSKMGVRDVAGIQFVRCHYVYGKQQVIVSVSG